MKKRTATTNVQDHVKSARRAAREADRAAGVLGHRRKSGEMAGATKAKASRDACRPKHNRQGWA